MGTTHCPHRDWGRAWPLHPHQIFGFQPLNFRSCLSSVITPSPPSVPTTPPPVNTCSSLPAPGEQEKQGNQEQHGGKATVRGWKLGGWGGWGGPSRGTLDSLDRNMGRDMSSDAGRDVAGTQIRSRQGCDCRDAGRAVGGDADRSSPPAVPLCPSTFLHASPRDPPAPNSPISAIRPPQPRYQHAASPSPRCSRSSGAKSPASCGGGRTLSLSGSCRVGGSWTGRALIDYTEDLGSLTAARAELAGGEASPAC